MTAHSDMPPTIHASTVIIGGSGILIRGLPRAGKTTLGQALVAAAGQKNETAPKLALWVSDDRTIVTLEGDTLIARAPSAIAGRIADRNLGILQVPHAQSAQLALIVDLDLRHIGDSAPGQARLLGQALPLLNLPPVTPDTVQIAVDRVYAALQPL